VLPLGCPPAGLPTWRATWHASTPPGQGHPEAGPCLPVPSTPVPPLRRGTREALPAASRRSLRSALAQHDLLCPPVCQPAGPPQPPVPGGPHSGGGATPRRVRQVRLWRPYHAAMWKRLWRYITANPGDPIPRTVTILGCAMSLAFWLYVGLYVGGVPFVSFLCSVAAALALVGPALFFSNIIVKKLQDARARTSVEPLLRAVNEMLCAVFEVADPAFPVLGYEGPQPPRQSHLDKPDFTKLAAALGRTLGQWMSAGQSLAATGTVGPYTIIRDMHPLTVPQLSLVSKLVQQADRYYQMPWSATGAVMAEDWGETCGFDFIDQIPPEGGSYYPATRETKVGLAEIRQYSRTNPVVIGAQLDSYFEFVRGCLHFGNDIANKLANEAPPLLFVDPADRPWTVRWRDIKWVIKVAGFGASAGPRPPRPVRG
jgi:hypothetical protein